MKFVNTSRQSQRGLSLVELMVAMAISLFLLIAIGLVYQSSKSGFNYANNTVRLSEDATFAIDTLSRDIRMAGYGGCAGVVYIDNPAINTTKSTPKLYNVIPPIATDTYVWPNLFSAYRVITAADAVRGFKGTDTESASLRTGMGIDSSSSYIVSTTAPMLSVSGGSERALQVSAGTAAGSTTIMFQGDPLKWANDATLTFRIISDCRGSEVFRSTGMNATTGVMTIDKPLINSYGSDAIVMPLISSTYFIAKRTGAQTSSLYRQYFNGIKRENEELVPNVEAITYQYGENTGCINGDSSCTVTTIPSYVADVYRTSPADVVNWSRVVSIRIGLIMVTEENGQTAQTSTTSDTIKWIAGDYTVPTADRRLRRAYSTTVSIRNRVAL